MAGVVKGLSAKRYVMGPCRSLRLEEEEQLSAFGQVPSRTPSSSYDPSVCKRILQIMRPVNKDARGG